MKKLLFISNICKNITNFHTASLDAAIALGYEFHFAANFNNLPKETMDKYPNIHFHHIDLVRFPFNIRNVKAYEQLNNLIKKENISVIHCNTPIGGALGRLCGKKTKHIKIFYTAHGFHFYKGAPLVNNCIYKPMEKYLAHYSDVIITMNEEDYHVAKTMKLRKSGHVYKVNGVGINTTDYQNININKEDYRNWLSLENDDFVCIAMGDLIKRKNYEMALRGIALCKNPKIHYLICGNGPEKNNLQDLAKNLGIREQVHFLGYRTDIKELLAISDCFLFTSLQEWLPRSLMEAMASGLPCIISDIRGNRDLIINNVNGYLIKSIEDCTQKLEAIISDKQLAKKMQVKNLEVIKKYDFLKVRDQINEIYKTELLGNE